MNNIIELGAPDYLALMGMLFSVIIFSMLAFQKSKKEFLIDSVFLANRSVQSNQFGSSFAAASSSLATVLIFFISTSTLYGPFLLWCGLTYLIGQALFLNFFKNKINIDTDELTTQADFFFRITKSAISSRVISVLTIITFLMIFFLEVYIGSEIIGYFFQHQSHWNKLISFVVIGTVIIGYLRLGGIKVVFRTDVWQYYLMIASCLSLLVFAIFIPNTLDVQSTQKWYDVNVNALQIFFFMAWILIINLTLPFTQLSSWQRLAATKNKAEAWNGFLKTIPGFLVIWVIPVVALLILNGKGIAPNTLSDLFTILRDAGGNLSILFFPIIFVGFSSALFSTADTALVALQYSIADKNTLGPLLSKTKNVKWFFILYTFVIVLLLSLIYSLVESDIGSWFLSFVFALFGQLSIIAPQIGYSLLATAGLCKRKVLDKKATYYNVLGIIFAWLFLMSASSYNLFADKPILGIQEVATYIAILISLSFLMYSLKITKEN